MAPYRRCANTPTVRVAISRWINPPGRRRPAMTAPDARSPLTVTDADDGEKGPGSASDKLVAKYVGKRGSIGVSNSPLAPPRAAQRGRPPAGRRYVDRRDVLDRNQPPRQRRRPRAHAHAAAHRQC